jgi:hypothetical protein
VVATLDLSSINQLVEIKNMELIAQIPSGNWSTETMTYKLLNQSKDTISIFLPELSYLKGVPIPTSKLLNIRGLCEMRSKDIQAPFLTNEYYIIPRYASDIKPVVNNSILEQNNNTEFIIFPNPADNILIIKSNKDKINKLTLFDSHGIELMQEFPASDTRTIDISYIPAGFYILEIVTNNDSRKIKISIF